MTRHEGKRQGRWGWSWWWMLVPRPWRPRPAEQQLDRVAAASTFAERAVAQRLADPQWNRVRDERWIGSDAYDSSLPAGQEAHMANTRWYPT